LVDPVIPSSVRSSWLTRAYLTIDPRSLGAGRIALGLVLLLDLLRRAPVITLWYSNQGLMPNHTALWRPPFPHTFSFFFMASWPGEAAIGFFLCGCAYLMLLVGNRTRLAHLASLLGVLSLHGRTLFVQNGGDVALVELCTWTLFLPMGARYSIDALRVRMRANPEARPDDLVCRGAHPPEKTPVVSLAVLAIVAQLAVIYLFNALQKNGPTWRGGSAIHYMLHSEGLVTALGLWVRGWLSPRQSQALTWSALAIEGGLPLLLLIPVAQRYARRLCIFLIVSLHVGIGLFFNLGIFAPAMIAFTPLLVPTEDWEAFESWRSRRARARRGGPRRVCLRLARVLNALDRQGVLRLRDTKSPEPAPWRLGLRARRASLRESALALLMILATVRTAFDNHAVTRLDASRQPKVVDTITTYLQMLQAWLLFAPDAPMTDAAVAVEAITADGRRVDPLNELASRHSWLGSTIPQRLGYDALMNAYLLRLPYWPPYFNAFEEWILRYPERTGRAGDRIVSFQVITLEQDLPPPGERQPRNARTHLLFKYPD
jgi:hypothetical protein